MKVIPKPNFRSRSKFEIRPEGPCTQSDRWRRCSALPASTLRYYDKQGLFPELERTSGIRRFGDTELEALRVIECLKKAGMEIKDIRLFMEWCAEGPSTYPQRKAMFEERKAHMESEIANMNRALDMLKFKCWYYEQAIQRWQRGQGEGADSRRFAGCDQRRLRKRPRSLKPFATHRTPTRSSFRAEQKRKPPNQRVRRLLFPLLCRWLCLATTNSIRRYSATPVREFRSQFLLFPFGNRSHWSKARYFQCEFSACRFFVRQEFPFDTHATYAPGSQGIRPPLKLGRRHLS